MKRFDFSRRILLPASIVLAAMLLSRIIYFNAPATAATPAGIVMFLCIGFGSFLIYPVSFFRGARLSERVLGCLVTPLVWNGIEMYNVGQAFTLSESLFYGTNILFIAAVAGQFLIMGVCDLFCRLRARAYPAGAVEATGPFPILACLSGIAGLYFVLVWREGVGLHYLFISLYKNIFL